MYSKATHAKAQCSYLDISSLVYVKSQTTVHNVSRNKSYFGIFSFEHANEPSLDWDNMCATSIALPKYLVVRESIGKTYLHVLHIPGQLLISEAPCGCNSAAFV